MKKLRLCAVFLAFLSAVSCDFRRRNLEPSFHSNRAGGTVQRSKFESFEYWNSKLNHYINSEEIDDGIIGYQNKNGSVFNDAILILPGKQDSGQGRFFAAEAKSIERVGDKLRLSGIESGWIQHFFVHGNSGADVWEIDLDERSYKFGRLTSGEGGVIYVPVSPTPAASSAGVM